MTDPRAQAVQIVGEGAMRELEAAGLVVRPERTERELMAALEAYKAADERMARIKLAYGTIPREFQLSVIEKYDHARRLRERAVRSGDEQEARTR